MKKIYDYGNRVIVHVNGKNMSYSRKIYGELFDKVVKLSYETEEKVQNYYEINEDITTIFTMNKGEVVKFFIDTEDFEKVRKYFWHINHNGYVVTSFEQEGKGKMYLHRFIKGVTKKDYVDEGIVVDHIDRNPLNNKKENLRVADTGINNRNITVSDSRKSRTGFRGVHFMYDKDGNVIDGVYRVRIGGLNKEEIFYDFEEAKKRRLELEKELGYIRTFND